MQFNEVSSSQQAKRVLYDSIGVDYNSTRCADPFLTERLLELGSPQKGSVCLDVGCGTGNYTTALASSSAGCSFYGIEPSEIMLEAAKRKSDSVFWAQASAEDLPFEKEFFDTVLATLTIHHWNDLEKGFAEICRVLKNGGKFVVFTAFPEQMETYWLNHYFPKMLADSMAVMPSRPKVEATLTSAGFSVIVEEKYFVQPDLQDLFLYSGKQRPSLYLDAEVRKGISSFSALSNKAEVENGLQKLAEDLDKEKFSEIAKNYESHSGDYVFIVAAKSS